MMHFGSVNAQVALSGGYEATIRTFNKWRLGILGGHING
jgi:hypothetical protein